MWIARLAVLLAVIFCVSSFCFAENSEQTERTKYELSNKSLAKASATRIIPDELLFSLLSARKFSELEKALAAAERKFEADVSYEIDLLWAYEAFRILSKNDDPKDLAAIDKWIASKNSYMAHTAKGFYLAGQAGQIRGGKFANQTPSENVKRATQLWRQSLESLRKSLSINDHFMPTYDCMMIVESWLGNRIGAKDAVTKALTFVPHAYTLRANYLAFLQPKWGNGYEEADKFIYDAQQYGNKNPRIWTLRGWVPGMMAYQHLLDGDFELALTKYSEALRYGDRPSWFKNKAYCQYMLGDYKNSKESLNKVSTYLSAGERPVVMRLVDVLENLDKQGGPRPYDTYNKSTRDSNGPLGWIDFQF